MNFKQHSDSGLLVPDSNILASGRYDCQLIRDGKVIDEWSDTELALGDDDGWMAVVEAGVTAL